jgi:hypothetical protein
LSKWTPFQSIPPQVVKIEDEGNSASFKQSLTEQELMDMFKKGVQWHLELRKKQVSTTPLTLATTSEIWKDSHSTETLSFSANVLATFH